MTKQQEMSHTTRPRTVSSPIPYGSEHHTKSVYKLHNFTALRGNHVCESQRGKNSLMFANINHNIVKIYCSGDSLVNGSPIVRGVPIPYPA